MLVEYGFEFESAKATHEWPPITLVEVQYYATGMGRLRLVLDRAHAGLSPVSRALTDVQEGCYVQPMPVADTTQEPRTTRVRPSRRTQASPSRNALPEPIERGMARREHWQKGFQAVAEDAVIFPAFIGAFQLRRAVAWLPEAAPDEGDALRSALALAVTLAMLPERPHKSVESGVAQSEMCRVRKLFKKAAAALVAERSDSYLEAALKASGCSDAQSFVAKALRGYVVRRDTGTHFSDPG